MQDEFEMTGRKNIHPKSLQRDRHTASSRKARSFQMGELLIKVDIRKMYEYLRSRLNDSNNAEREGAQFKPRELALELLFVSKGCKKFIVL